VYLPVVCSDGVCLTNLGHPCYYIRAQIGFVESMDHKNILYQCCHVVTNLFTIMTVSALIVHTLLPQALANCKPIHAQHSFVGRSTKAVPRYGILGCFHHSYPCANIFRRGKQRHNRQVEYFATTLRPFRGSLWQKEIWNDKKARKTLFLHYSQ
jgi:hypothetical protein